MTHQPARPQPLTAEELAENTIRRYKNMDPGHESPMTMLWADAAFQLACAVKCPVDAAKPAAVQVDRDALRSVLTHITYNGGLSKFYAVERMGLDAVTDALIASGLVSTPPAAQVDREKLREQVVRLVDGIYPQRWRCKLCDAQWQEPAAPSHLPHCIVPGLLTPAAQAPEAPPIDMILHCPRCHFQHVDEPEYAGLGVEGGSVLPSWNNPPHRSHQCQRVVNKVTREICGYVWRPADVATNGVKAIQTRGKADSPEAPAPVTTEPTQGWRDIASAPTDGTTVDLWIDKPATFGGTIAARAYRVCNAQFLNDSWLKPGLSRWVDWDHATHWQPLPEPPAPSPEDVT